MAPTMNNLQPDIVAGWKMALAERLMALGRLGSLRILSAQYIAQDNLRAAYGDLLVFYRGADGLAGAFYADVEFDLQELFAGETGSLTIPLNRPVGRLVLHWRAIGDDLFSYAARTNWAPDCESLGAYAVYPIQFLLTCPGVKHYPGFFGETYAVIRDRILTEVR